MNKYEELTTVLEVNGPYYTEEDCIDHKGVAAVIHDKDKILLMDHVKIDRWAIPVGKVKPGDSIEHALKEEMLEELGIELINYNEIISFVRPYLVNGIHHVKVEYHIFDILKYSGEIKNLEPNKHRSIKFMTLDKIRKMERISTATKAILKYYGI